MILGSILVTVSRSFFFKYTKVEEPVPLAKPIISNNSSNEFGGCLKYLFCCSAILFRPDAKSGIPGDSEFPAELFNFFAMWL